MKLNEMIQSALDAGFEDVGMRQGDLSLKKGNVHAWECVHDRQLMYAVAELIDGYFRNHTYHEEFEDALTDAKKRFGGVQ